MNTASTLLTRHSNPASFPGALPEERPTRRRTSGLSKLPSFVGSPRAPAAPAPPPAPLLAPPPPRQGAGEWCPFSSPDGDMPASFNHWSETTNNQQPTTGCEVSPRQKFRNSAANQSRVIPSVEVSLRCNTFHSLLSSAPSPSQGDASPEFFALRLEDTKKEVSCDEMLALYDKLVHQPYAWVDAFIAAKGT